MKCYKCDRQLLGYGVEQQTGCCKYHCEWHPCLICQQTNTEKWRGICVKPCQSPKETETQYKMLWKNVNCELCGRKNIGEENNAYTTHANVTVCFNCWCTIGQKFLKLTDIFLLLHQNKTNRAYMRAWKENTLRMA